MAQPQKPSYGTTYYRNLGKTSSADYENKNGSASMLTKVIEIVVTSKSSRLSKQLLKEKNLKITQGVEYNYITHSKSC